MGEEYEVSEEERYACVYVCVTACVSAASCVECERERRDETSRFRYR